MLLHFITSSNSAQPLSQRQQEYGHSDLMPMTKDLESHIAESCKMVATTYGIFKSEAAEQVIIS